MRVEGTVHLKVKESPRRATLAKSGTPIPLVFMPEDRVLRTTVVMVDECTCVGFTRRFTEGKWQGRQFTGRGGL